MSLKNDYYYILQTKTKFDIIIADNFIGAVNLISGLPRHSLYQAISCNVLCWAAYINKPERGGRLWQIYQPKQKQ